jgi:hypothetical protein
MTQQEEASIIMMVDRMELIAMLRRLTHPNADDTDLEDALLLLQRFGG